MGSLKSIVCRIGWVQSQSATFITICSILFFGGIQARHINKQSSIDVQGRLESYLSHMADSGFAFSALVVVNGMVVVQKGYGWSDSGKSGRTSDRTLFNVASMTKSFTSICIFSLLENHLLALNDSLPKFFPYVPTDKRSITITHLLTHTSGLPQNYSADGFAIRDSAVENIFIDSLKFPPGTDFAYSNESYELLGAIIEIVSGKTYEDMVREIILQPARMHDTMFWADTIGDDSVEIASKNRNLDPSVLKRNWGYIASGGLYSNVSDLHLWFTALSGGQLLDPRSVEHMWQVQRKLTDTGMAYGWFVSQHKWGREIWTRGNEDWGHNGVLRWFPDQNTLIIVLSNSGERGNKNETANRFISDGVTRILFE